MRNVKWDVLCALRNHDHALAQHVRDTHLVEHIRVPSREVADDNTGTGDQRNDVLDDVVMNPDVVGTTALHPRSRDRRLQCVVDGVETSIKWHHHRDKVVIDGFIVQREYLGLRAIAQAMLHECPEQVRILDGPMGPGKLPLADSQLAG